MTSPTCFEPCGFIFRETAVDDIWYDLHVSMWAVWWTEECVREAALKSLPEDEPTRFETRQRQQKLNINPFKYEAQTALFKDPVRTAQ